MIKIIVTKNNFLAYIMARELNYDVSKNGSIIIKGNMNFGYIKVESLPEDIKILGDLTIENIYIGNLPKTLIIEGKIHRTNSLRAEINTTLNKKISEFEI